MGQLSSIYAWIGFGICAGIIAMVLPYHRGLRGILTNLGIGVGGALAGGYLSRGLHLYGSVADPAGFLYAASGAFLALLVFHVVWSRRHTRHHHHGGRVTG